MEAADKTDVVTPNFEVRETLTRKTSAEVGDSIKNAKLETIQKEIVSQVNFWNPTISARRFEENNGRPSLTDWEKW